MFNLIEYSDNYLKTPGGLWQHYRDEPSLDNNDNIVDFTGANYNSKLFKYQEKTDGSNGCCWQKKWENVNHWSI